MGELRATAVTEVHVILPEGIDDPARPSGGNTYDRQVCRGLAALGWAVHEHAVADAAALAHVVERIPDGAVVLLDGLIASPAPEALVPHSTRLRQVVLMHMPLGDRREREVLEAAVAVVVTSEWARRRLDALYGLPAHVAEPGVDIAGLAPGTASGDALLCVAAVTPGKGHDVLLDGLATLGDLPWRCTCVGSLDRDPAFAAEVRRHALRDRVRFPGPRTGAELDDAYAAADLLVLASHAETYGMVVTEALARGLPVLAADVGGVTEALGHGEDGTRPGLLVPPGDPAALGAALRAWLGDARAAGAPAAGRPGAARVAARVAGHHVGRLPASSRERRDERAGRQGQPGVARPARAGRRRGALGRARRAPRAAPSRGPPGDPRPRRRQRRDGPLARTATARAAALGRARPGRRPAATRLGHVRDAAVRHHAPDAGGSRRRERDRRLGAARHADCGRARRDARRVRRAPDAHRDDRGRPRQPEPGGSPGRAARGGVQCPPAPRRPARSGRRRRCRRSAARRRGPRPAEPLAPRCGPRRPADQVVRRVGHRRSRAGALARRRGRRLPRPAPGAGGRRRARGQVDHADLLVLP